MPDAPFMTPKTPPPSDGSDTPPRHRLNLGITAKDSAELDLWAFDDEQEIEEMPVPKPTKQGIPEPRYPADGPTRELPPESPKKLKPLPSGLPEAMPGGHESIRVNVNPRIRPSFAPSPPREPQKPAVRANPRENFDDLDQWEEPQAVAPAPAKPTPATTPPSAFKEMPRTESSAKSAAAPQETSESRPESSPLAPAVRQPAQDADDRDEFSTHVRAVAGQPSVPLRPTLNLNRIERIGLALLVLLLLAAGTVFYFNTLQQLPAGSGRVEPSDFPIQGAKVEALSALSYWRKPITSGPSADTVQRETLLIPVAEFTTRGGPATLRIFFRNEYRDLVGDVLTRSVQGEEKLVITATAGFDDLGKHAAYRTRQTEPWTIEVLEAPPGNPSAADFKRLFEMNIGTDLR
jgi:hypothetical protein